MERGGGIVLGVCAMDCKARSRSMQELLQQLIRYGQIEIVVIGEQDLLHEPVENWAVCNCFVAFASAGFPLEKAQAYCELRKPFCVQDLASQRALQDRRRMYSLLQSAGVPLPRWAFVNRDPRLGPVTRCRQFGDALELDGGAAVFSKPFVEKPLDADDHNHVLYFPGPGGGARRLFRKTGDLASAFVAGTVRVRDDASYIYQEFVMPDPVCDIKVYSVGAYVYAEQRKSPALGDGRVERDDDGRERRRAVQLTDDERDMVRKVAALFRQTVCGVDLLRTRDKTFVIDVNGWSFVKGKGPEQLRYYQLAAAELYKLMADYIAHSSTNADLHQLSPATANSSSTAELAASTTIR